MDEMGLIHQRQCELLFFFFTFLFVCFGSFLKNKSMAKTKFVRQLGHLNTVESLRHFAGGGLRHVNTRVRWCQIYRLMCRGSLAPGAEWMLTNSSSVPFGLSLASHTLLGSLSSLSGFSFGTGCHMSLTPVWIDSMWSLHFNHIFTDSLPWLLGPLHKPKFIPYGW